ncbi:plasmid mobilization relaxosome protein MobC [Brevundimonas diminuta]|uniref:plasmid mobilization relaxosome protein MobC n=1 Tax=Brevundimonas diminuta TaxID=293 RepID=UPI003CFD915C
MDRFTVRLPPDLACRFDAAASACGGRSRLLRRLIEASAGDEDPRSGPASAEPLTGKLTLRLGAADLAAVEAEATRVGLSRTQWVVALVRRRLHGQPQLSPGEAVAFIEIQRDLRRIGVNLNQIARTVNATVPGGRAPGVELVRVLAFAEEVRGGLSGLRRAFEGNLDYWSAGS